MTFELEHDAELIAHKLKIDSLMVEEIMRYVITLGLFEVSENRITCMKLAKHFDERFAKTPEMKLVIASAKKGDLTAESLKELTKKSEDGLKTVARLSEGGLPLVEGRREEKRIKSNGDEYAADFVTFWANYPNKANKAAAYKAWKKLKPSAALTETILSDITSRDWRHPFIPHAGTYLNNRRWEDEITVTLDSGKEVYL